MDMPSSELPRPAYVEEISTGSSAAAAAPQSPLTQREKDLRVNPHSPKKSCSAPRGACARRPAWPTSAWPAGCPEQRGQRGGFTARAIERIDQPAAGDWAWPWARRSDQAQLLANARPGRTGRRAASSLLGPRFSNEEIRRLLDSQAPSTARIDATRSLRRVARFSPRKKSSAGCTRPDGVRPRALGSRSNLDARSPAMQKVNPEGQVRESSVLSLRRLKPCPRLLRLGKVKKALQCSSSLRWPRASACRFATGSGRLESSRSSARRSPVTHVDISHASRPSIPSGTAGLQATPRVRGQDRLPRARQHEFQHPRRADVSTPRTPTAVSWHQHRRPLVSRTTCCSKRAADAPNHPVDEYLAGSVD